MRIKAAYRPSTRAAHDTHCRTYLSFVLFMNLPLTFSLHSLLAFLEFLNVNNISPRVIQNYLSSLKHFAKIRGWDISPFHHKLVLDYIHSIAINSSFSPDPKGIFDLKTLALIIQTCDLLYDPPLYKAAFLLAFFAFLRMSNIAPHSKQKFQPHTHFLRQDIIFAPPGAHDLLKWTKTLQDRKAHHFVQIPEIPGNPLCPVQGLKDLLASRPLPPTHPLFAHRGYPHYPVIDTSIRDALKVVLNHLNIPLQGHLFHAFRRSGATLAFDNNVQLQDIMDHGLWRSSAVWHYLQKASVAPSIIPTTFASIFARDLGLVL